MLQQTLQMHRQKPVVWIGLSIIRLLWQRQYKTIYFSIAYMVLIAIILRITHPATIYAILLSVPIALAPVALTVLCAVDYISESNFGYPNYLLVAPVRTTTLAVWPMVYGVLLQVLYWLLFDSIIVRPEGWPLSNAIPPLIITSVCLWMQAISWSTFLNRRPLLLLVLLALAVEMVSYNPLINHASTTAEKQVAWTVVLLVINLLALPTALIGLKMSRCGVGMPSGLWQRLVGKLDAVASRLLGMDLPKISFRSIFDAQAWFEWKSRGLLTAFGACAASFGCIAVIYPIAIIKFPLLSTDNSHAFGIQLTSSWELYLDDRLVIWLSSFMIGLMMIALSSSDKLRNEAITGTFFSARPITNVDVVAAKLKSAIKGTLISLPLTLCVLLLPARFGVTRAPVGLLLFEHASALIVCQVMATIVGILYVLWKLSTDFLWLTLLPIRQQAWIISCGVSTLVGLALADNYVIPIIPYRDYICVISSIVALSCLVKLLLLCWTLYVLIQRRLISRLQLVKIAAIWTIVFVGVSAAAVTLTYPYPISRVLPILFVLLFMPGVRIAFAPIAFDFSRHR